MLSLIIVVSVVDLDQDFNGYLLKISSRCSLELNRLEILVLIIEVIQMIPHSTNITSLYKS
jgi:hypothetical protein